MSTDPPLYYAHTVRPLSSISDVSCPLNSHCATSTETRQELSGLNFRDHNGILIVFGGGSGGALLDIPDGQLWLSEELRAFVECRCPSHR